MAWTVLVPKGIHPAGTQWLDQHGMALKWMSGTDEASMQRDIAACDAVLARTHAFTRAVIQAASQLKVIARHGVGYDNIDLNACEERGIIVCNAPMSNANAVAEHTIALLLACAHQLTLVNRELLAGHYGIRDEAPCIDVEHKVLGLIGCGRIGAMVAKKAIHGLEMQVLCYDPFLLQQQMPEGVHKCETMEEVFAQGDFVSLHLPVTQQTRGCVDARMLSHMKPTAYLINCARGEVVDQEALYDALKKGRIAGAGLDVFDREPPGMIPLLYLENVIATPHSAAQTKEASMRMSLHAAQEIVRVYEGKAPLWQVNKPRA